MWLFVSFLLYSAEAAQSCSSCRVALTSFQVWATNTKNANRINSFISYVCSQTWAPSDCTPVLTGLIPEISLALQQHYFNPDRFCSAIMACASPMYTQEDFEAWETSVMEGFAAYFEPTTGESYFNFAQISDLHVDSKYVPGSSSTCSNPPCCRGAAGVNDIAGPWGNYNCDLPQATLDRAASFLASQTLDFIIWTGDTAAHDNSLSSAQRIAAVQSATQMFWNKFNNVVPVYPIFGNSDTYMDTQYSFGQQNPLASATATMWAPWIGATAANNLKTYGRYSLIHRNTNLKIIAVNTLACDVNNFWLLSNVTDPGGNIAFLRSELAAAESANQYVYIIGHMPPASESCLALWSRHYQVLVRRYNNIIRGQFFGHLHTDELRLTNDQQSKPIGIQFISPSMDPLNYHNPSFRIYKSDYLSKSVLTYTQYRMDLTAASPQFYAAYEFLSYYIVKNMFPATIKALAEGMVNNEMVSMKYVSNKYTASSATPVGCDAQCRSDNYCDIVNDRPDTIRVCKGLKQSPADYWLGRLYGAWVYKS